MLNLVHHRQGHHHLPSRRRRAQRGSARDPLFEYERGQANRLLRGQDEAPMSVDDIMKMYSGKKRGGTLGRGMGKALRGGGKVMK